MVDTASFSFSYVDNENMVTVCGKLKIWAGTRNCHPDTLKEERATGFKNREGIAIIKTKDKKAQAVIEDDSELNSE